MAKKGGVGLGSTTRVVKPSKRRKGIVAKSRASKNPNSRNYLKRYRGQGR